MSRVAINKKKYMIKDLPAWIVGKMHTEKKRQVDLAEEIGITQPAMSQRLGQDLDSFSYGDLLTLFKVLNATDEEILRLMRL